MKKIFLLVAILFSLRATGQINYEKSNGSLRILPPSSVLPTTTITTDGFYEDEGECAFVDTPIDTFRNQPWFGNNQFLYDYLDNLGYPIGYDPRARVESIADVKYRIPIKFWIYRRTDGTGGITEFGLKNLLDRVNHDYRQNGTAIRFFQMCSPEYIDDSNKINFSTSDQVLAPAWIGFRATQAAINVHIVESITGAGGIYIPTAPNAVFITWNTASSFNSAVTLSHEIGHLFKLDHTHAYHNWLNMPNRNCLVEPVDRNRRYPDFTLCDGSHPFQNVRMCELTGDGLCDTPADPKLSIDQSNRIASCVWVDATVKDHFNDTYGSPPAGSLKPDVTNIMSYASRDCRTKFSYGQVGVIIHSIETKFTLYKTRWKSGLDIFDTFEPDNSILVAGPINEGEQQERTFHFNGQISNTTCDTDWVKFTVTETKLHTIETRQVPGKTNADTEIRLYSVSGAVPNQTTTLIASNDNFNGTVFSQIQQSLIPGEYAIEIVNKNTSISGYYNLLRFSCADPQLVNISGPSFICSSSNSVFTLSNVPSGTNIVWQNGSNVQYVSGQGTTSYTVTGNGYGTGTVSAILCGNTNVPEKTFQVGVPKFTSPHVRGIPYTGMPVALCPGNHWLGTTVEGATSGLSWTVPFPNVITGGGTYVDFTLPSAFSGATIIASASNSCGVNNLNFYLTRQTSGCSSSFSLVTYPNPSQDELAVELQPLENSTEASKKAREAIIDEITLFDKNARPIQSLKNTRQRGTLSVRHLPPGFYYLKVRLGKEVFERQIQVEHK